ncbi:hypothetical protein TNCV_787681 [Trichonephila clavipes]|nr:hypothetical protein TNCV_787681 [Trichonephila clavipes]
MVLDPSNLDQPVTTRFNVQQPGLCSNPGEGMDVCRCIVFLRYGVRECTLIDRGAENPLVRLVEGEERSKVLDHAHGILPQIWGWKRAKSHCPLHGAQSYG